MDALYSGVLITVGALIVSSVSRKVLKDTLGVPMTMSGAAKLATAVGLGAVGVKYAQREGLGPKEDLKVYIIKLFIPHRGVI